MKKDEIITDILNNAVKLISFPTYDGNDTAFEDLFDFIKKKMSGFIIKDIIINNGHMYHNLLISNVDTTDFDIIYCGHVDVVKNSKYKAKVIGNKIYGRGAIDMKGQVAVMMEVLKTAKTSKKVALLITSDEEVGGYCCETILKGLNAKVAVLPDGGKNYELVVEEKGIIHLDLISKGLSAHASEPYNGNNAIIKLINLYNDLIKMYPLPKSQDDWRLSINLSRLNGGDADNKVPDTATMYLDIRYTSNDNVDRIIKYIKNYSDDVSIAKVVVEPLFCLNQDLEIVNDFINNAETILKKKVVKTKCSAGSDAVYFSEKGIPVIMMNPVGDYWHNPNEYAEIDSYYMLYKIFKSIL